MGSQGEIFFELGGNHEGGATLMWPIAIFNRVTPRMYA